MQPKKRPVPPLPVGPGLFVRPYWLARLQLPPPLPYYVSFCRYLARTGMGPADLAQARPLPRLTRAQAEARGFDGTGSAFVVSDFHEGWPARDLWSFDWFRQ